MEIYRSTLLTGSIMILDVVYIWYTVTTIYGILYVVLVQHILYFSEASLSIILETQIAKLRWIEQNGKTREHLLCSAGLVQ